MTLKVSSITPNNQFRTTLKKSTITQNFNGMPNTLKAVSPESGSYKLLSNKFVPLVGALVATIPAVSFFTKLAKGKANNQNDKAVSYSERDGQGGHWETTPDDEWPEDWEGAASGAGYTPRWVSNQSSQQQLIPGSGD